MLILSVAAGCKTLTISINQTNPPVFTFSAGHFAECCDHLAFLMVSEIPADRSEPKVIWDIRPVPGTDNSAEGLPKITYGEVPPGFVQKIPAAGPPPRLEEGKTYQASGPQVEVPEAYVRFRVENARIVPIPSR